MEMLLHNLVNGIKLQALQRLLQLRLNSVCRIMVAALLIKPKIKNRFKNLYKEKKIAFSADSADFDYS